MEDYRVKLDADLTFGNSIDNLKADISPVN